MSYILYIYLQSVRLGTLSSLICILVSASDSIGMIIFTTEGHLVVKTKMAAIGHIEFLPFYRISLESCVIPHID